MAAGVIGAMSIREAIDRQFALVDCIHRNFPDGSFLDAGDLGLPAGGQPRKTALVEKTLADFFGTEDCVLVRGAGTGAIRLGLESMVRPGARVLIHDAPVYPSSLDTLEHMGVELVRADFNAPEAIRAALRREPCAAALVQHTRQLLTDSYELCSVVRTIREAAACPVLVDDNYAVMKDPVCGAEAGAALSAFSMFKLQGPEGIGCLVGARELVATVRKRACTGGTQVQGFEAMEALRALVTAPVALAIQAEETDRILRAVARLIEAGGSGISNVYEANMQSRVLMVEFERPIAKSVIANAVKLGASPYPVGAESKYEIPALFYKASRTFLASNERGADCFIRINPMRAGCDTVMRILKEAVEKALQEG